MFVNRTNWEKSKWAMTTTSSQFSKRFSDRKTSEFEVSDYVENWSSQNPNAKLATLPTRFRTEFQYQTMPQKSNEVWQVQQTWLYRPFSDRGFSEFADFECTTKLSIGFFRNWL